MRVRSLLAALSLVALSAGSYEWHNHLTKSAPTADQVLGASPTEVRLWFAENVEPMLSSIGMTTGDGGLIELGKPRRADDPRSITVDLSAPLPPGLYKVGWRTAGDDVHQVKGTFQFTVH
jgi:methionine-rich copper-binding protein CopC